MNDRSMLMRRALATSLLSVSFAAACGDGCGCTPPPFVPPTFTPPSDVVTIADERVRACEALLESAGQEVPRASFHQDLRGELVPKAPRFAVSFAARADESLAGKEAIRLEWKGDRQDVTVIQSACFDAQGAKLDGVSLEFGTTGATQ